MKGKKGTRGEGRYAANIRFTIRLTPQEKMRLDEQADIAGLSVSEYMRRRFFGGTIAAYTDLRTVGELRRIGGLLKHNFATLRQENAPSDILKQQEDALRKLVWMIQKIGLVLDDRQKNQEQENWITSASPTTEIRRKKSNARAGEIFSLPHMRGRKLK